MSTANAARFACGSCKKTFAWKPELAGKKAKCTCGNVIIVPKEIAPPPPPPADDDMYDLVDVPEEKPKRPVPVAAAPDLAIAGGGSVVGLNATSAKAKSTSKSSVPLSYQGMPGQRKAAQTDATSSTMMDPVRDIYVPVGLLLVGFFIQSLDYMLHTRHGMLFSTIGITAITVFKGLLLCGFAVVMAGPLGVSFGSPLTMVLKLLAIACFCDGVVSWMDYGLEKAGSHGMGFYVELPVLFTMFALLLVYLFSMDFGDSIFVVCLMSAFDIIMRVVVFVLILGFLFGGGDGGGSSRGGRGTAGAGGSSTSSATSAEDEFTDRVDELKETDSFQEARAYIESGKQAGLKEKVDAWYAAGAKNVWFEVIYDPSRKSSPVGLVMELPEDKDQRAKIFEMLNTKKPVDPDEIPEKKLIDTGQVYLKLGLIQ